MQKSSLAVYNNEFMHASAQNITVTTKSMKICYIFNINHIHLKIVRRQTEITHQQRVSRSGSSIIERAASE